MQTNTTINPIPSQKSQSPTSRPMASAPYTPQQLHLASQSLSSPLSILLLLDYLEQTGDVMGLVHGYQIMGKVRTSLEEYLKQNAATDALHLRPLDSVPKLVDSPMETEDAASEALEQRQHLSVAASLGHTQPSPSGQSRESLLTHLYMLLKSLLSYRHGDVCTAFFRGEIPDNKKQRRRPTANGTEPITKPVVPPSEQLTPENIISLLLADSNIERRTIALEIVAMLLESDLVNVKQWCTEEFCVQLLNLVTTPNDGQRISHLRTKPAATHTSVTPSLALANHGLHRAVIEVLGALLRRELLTPNSDFTWIQLLIKNHWNQFEALFSQITAQHQGSGSEAPSFFYMDEDSFLVACSFLEMLSFQVPLDSDSKKEVQKLGDTLKISRWNLSRREQRKIHDAGLREMKSTKERESEIYATYGELLHNNEKQEEMISRIKKSLSDQRRELNQVRSREEKSQKTFLLGVLVSIGMVGAFYLFRRNVSRD